MFQAVLRSSNNGYSRLISFRDRFGTTAAICKAIDVVLQKSFRAYIHEVVWLDSTSVAEMVPPAAQFSFRFLTPDEITAFAADPSYFIEPDLAESVRSGRGACFAALAGDRLAAFGYYTIGFVKPEQAAGAVMSFPSDVAYMSYGFTHPDFRGERLHGLIMGLALKALANRGITKVVSLVAWTNWASLKSCDRLGYVRLGKMITRGGKRSAIGLYPRRGKKLGVRFGRKALQPA